MKEHLFGLITVLVVLVSHNVSVAGVIGTSHMDSNHAGDPLTFTIDQVFADNSSGWRDFTGFRFELASLPFGQFSQPANRYRGSFLDEGADVYIVDVNDHFTESNILNGDFTELQSDSIYDFPSSFYLGIRTGSFGVGFSPPPAYGWARFENNSAYLALVDHAVAYECQGIIVGSLIAIPEPTTLSLMVALSMFAFTITKRARV